MCPTQTRMTTATALSPDGALSAGNFKTDTMSKKAAKSPRTSSVGSLNPSPRVPLSKVTQSPRKAPQPQLQPQPQPQPQEIVMVDESKASPWLVPEPPASARTYSTWGTYNGSGYNARIGRDFSRTRILSEEESASRRLRSRSLPQTFQSAHETTVVERVPLQIDVDVENVREIVEVPIEKYIEVPVEKYVEVPQVEVCVLCVLVLRGCFVSVSVACSDVHACLPACCVCILLCCVCVCVCTQPHWFSSVRLCCQRGSAVCLCFSGTIQKDPDRCRLFPRERRLWHHDSVICELLSIHLVVCWYWREYQPLGSQLAYLLQCL